MKPIQPTILIDTAEQLPFAFDLPTERVHLVTADYSVKGLEQFIRLERKAGDIPLMIGKGRERFEAMLLRMTAFPKRLLLLETDAYNIEHGLQWCDNCGGRGTGCRKCLGQGRIQWRSRVTINSVRGTLATWMARYDLPILFGGTHTTASRWAERWLIKAAGEIAKTHAAAAAYAELASAVD